MNWIFDFNPDEVAALVGRSLAPTRYVATSEQAWNNVAKEKLEPGLILVVGRGVYLASNDAEQDWENGSFQKSFADGGSSIRIIQRGDKSR